MPVNRLGSPPGVSPSHTPDKTETKTSKKSGFLRWRTSTAKKVKGILPSAKKQPLKSIGDFDILTPEDTALATLDSFNIKGEKLGFQGLVNAEDPKFKEVYESVRKVLTKTMAPSKSDPSVAAQLETDLDRNRFFKLKAHLPNKILEAGQDPRPVLAETVNELAPDNPDALMLQLSGYCTQLCFNPLIDLFQVACKGALNDSAVCTLASEHKRSCILDCTGETVDVHLVVHSKTMRIFPAMDEPVILQSPVMIKAVISIPIDEPENGSLKKVLLHISKPSLGR